MARQDPLRNFRFRLEIDGIETAGFTEVDGLEATTEAIDYREGTDPPHVRKLPGLHKYSNVVLKRGITVGAGALELYKWHAGVVAGSIQAARKNIAVVVMAEDGSDQARFAVTDAWPVKYAAGVLDAKGNEVLIELLELANEGIERIQ
jgi:phage tail-like protein